jgi:chromosome segregation ATPase
MIKNAFALVLFAVSIGRCQTPEKPDILQSLLTEVHQLRQDIEAMTVASQRVQIALYALQMQDAVVARATLRFDSIHDKCVAAESAHQKLASDIQSEETILASRSFSEDDAKHFQAQISEEKRLAESKSAEVQSCQSMEAQASSRLQAEQATLADLQERIHRLDKALEKLAGGDK